MPGRGPQIPLFVLLMALVSVAMLLPVFHAVSVRAWLPARAFFYSALLWGIVTTLFAIATRGSRVRSAARAQLLTLVGAFTLLPAMMALPVAVLVPQAGTLDAWFEMVSAATTTGATLFAAETVPDTVHLWRALVGWMGGYFMWLVALALLAPMNLGGFEVTSGADVGAGARVDRVRGQRDEAESRRRLASAHQALLPVYLGLTLLLWLSLILSGESPFVAGAHAMSTLSTSGISPLATTAQSTAGIPGEALILVFFVFALSRRTFAPDRNRAAPWAPQADPEIRLALSLIGLVAGVLFLRHWIGALEASELDNWQGGLRAAWGTIFTVASFLSTTGFMSSEWETAQLWSGLPNAGLVLMGLALAGGGVATTAGGVKLMRVYALLKHGQRELNRLVHPHSVGGKGPEARRIRGQGAYVAWIFVMLFALSFAAVACLLALTGVDFEAALILAVAALANCGPLVPAVLTEAAGFGTLSEGAKILLPFAMILGRLEALAIIALFNPGFWRP